MTSTQGSGDGPAEENPLSELSDGAGPELWANWRASIGSAPSAGASEYAIYSDAHVTGELLDGLGPYKIFNGLGSVAGLGVAVVLRAEQHLLDPPPRDIDWSRGRTAHWVGHAPVSDHVASLLSLCLNARFRSGGTIREFPSGQDPRGRPIFIQHRSVALPAPEHGPLIPGLAGPVSLDGGVGGRLATVPALSAADATALLRAARQYRQALWSSESDPELSWLLLVGAAETGALAHAGSEGEPSARLEEVMPDLADVLIGAQVKGTAQRRAVPSTDVGGAPGVRAGWRSLGTALRPRHPLGGSTWLAKDVPMHLHVFAHIVRGALLRWWAAAATASTARPPGPRDQ